MKCAVVEKTVVVFAIQADLVGIDVAVKSKEEVIVAVAIVVVVCDIVIIICIEVKQIAREV